MFYFIGIRHSVRMGAWIVKFICEIKMDCYASQLKYVFRLEENVSREVGQNSLTP